jgi:hypothetical protein
MKKAAIIMLTAFYLLLTTGIYGCILACANVTLNPKTQLEMSLSNACEAQHNEHARTVNVHSCCGNQSSFVIREHQEWSAEQQFTGVAALLNPLLHYHNAAQPVLVKPFQLADHRKGFWRSGKACSIRFRSIQI